MIQSPALFAFCCKTARQADTKNPEILKYLIHFGSIWTESLFLRYLKLHKKIIVYSTPNLSYQLSKYYNL
jgi:hypothetical protein